MANEKSASAKITFSDLFARLESAQLTANHYKLITAAVLGDMLEFFDYYIIGFVLAFIVVPWNLSFAATAMVLLSAGVGSLIGSFFFGHLADRIGRMPVLYITTATFTIPSGIMYFTPEGNWIFLSLFRFLVGFGVGGLYSVDLPLVQEFMPSRYRGVIGGIVTALIPAGTLLGSLSAAYLTPVIGWRGLFLIGLAPALLSLMFRFWMRESPRWLIRQGSMSRRSIDQLDYRRQRRLSQCGGRREGAGEGERRRASWKSSSIRAVWPYRGSPVSFSRSWITVLCCGGRRCWRWC